MIHSCCSCKSKCPGVFLTTDDKDALVTHRCPCQSCHGRLFRFWDLLARAILERDHRLYLDIDCQIKLTNRHEPLIEITVLMESWKDWQSLNEGDCIWAAQWLASGITNESPAIY